MASCIVKLHYITGYDANSSFYGKGKSSVSALPVHLPALGQETAKTIEEEEHEETDEEPEEEGEENSELSEEEWSDLN